jgi:hypothetical protein
MSKINIQALLVAMLVVGAIFSGVRWAERRWATEKKELENLADERLELFERAMREWRATEETLTDARYGTFPKNPLAPQPGERYYQH